MNWIKGLNNFNRAQGACASRCSRAVLNAVMRVTCAVTNAVTLESGNPSNAKGQANGAEGSFARQGIARRLSAIIFSIILSSCSHPYNFITENKPVMLDVEVDNGPVNYRAAYHDGCTSALAAFGNSYQKSLYHLERDPQYANDRLYNQTWKDAWGYCYMWLFAYNNEKTVSMYGKPLF